MLQSIKRRNRINSDVFIFRRCPCFYAGVILLTLISPFARADDSLPHIVQKDGRYALFVDGAPYLILGAQVNNSSAWPAMLPQVWPAMDYLHVNTVEIPIYWEQLEPEQGHFNFSIVDILLAQAREHNVHLVLLWFGTWKNGSNHYMPQWMKLDPARYPNQMSAEGKDVDSPSPFGEETLAADIKAFTALMSHLKDKDPQHTVLLVQVENEAGSWQSARDFSPTAQKIFDAPVPAEVLKAMRKQPPNTSANWKDVFGDDADEFFQVWYVARFIGQVAAAGKTVYPLPFYVNVSVRDPFAPHSSKYEIGGPDDNVFPLWKAAAPAIDILSPDIYQRDPVKYLKLLDIYRRPDNPLFVPETMGQGAYTRFLYAALGRGAIGYSPFGMDYTRAFTAGVGDALTPSEGFVATSLNYQAIGPMMREIARLNFEGKLKTAVAGEEPSAPSPSELPSPDTADEADRVLQFKGWDADISFGSFTHFHRNPTTMPFQLLGRILIAQLTDNRFLVTGLYARVKFQPNGSATGKPWQYLCAEEGQYADGQFQRRRILNGDQTDYGLIFTTNPSVVRASLYTR
jgi:hypothetical protein